MTTPAPVVTDETTRPRKPRSAPRVKLCANKAHPHEGLIHAHGMCVPCAVYRRRNGFARPAGLIQVDLLRKGARAAETPGRVS